MKRFALIVGLVLSACVGQATGGDEPDADPGPGTDPVAGDAFLRIVGETNVFVDGGTAQTLTVKYVNGAGVPLAGRVNFKLEGDYFSSAISRTTGTTNSLGEIYLDVIGGSEDAAFQVVAEDAQGFARSVAWSVAVTAGEIPPANLDPVGTYNIESQFDVVTGIPGTVGDILNAILDMTDDPNDPATWILDTVAANLDPGTALDLLEGGRPALDGVLNELILSFAPEWVNTFIKIGDQIGQVAHKLGLNGTLVVVASGEPDVPYRVTHTVNVIQFVIDGVKYPYELSELSLSPIVAANIPLTMFGDLRVNIGDHSMSLSWGAILTFALNNLIVPVVCDAYETGCICTNLYEMVTVECSPVYINCYQIGIDVADFVGFGNPGIYEAACDIGIQYLTAYIEDTISSIGGTGAALNIHGEAKPIDTTGDYKVDKFFTGLWEGTMSFVGISTASELQKPNQKFTATRQGSGPGKPE